MANEGEEPLEHLDMVAADIERLAGGARDVTQRQQDLRCCEVLASAPIDGRVLSAATRKILNQGGLACARFSSYSNDASVPAVCFRKSLRQTIQLVVPL